MIVDECNLRSLSHARQVPGKFRCFVLAHLLIPALETWSRDAPAASLRANISETSLVPLINEQKGEKEEIRDEREFHLLITIGISFLLLLVCQQR